MIQYQSSIVMKSLVRKLEELGYETQVIEPAPEGLGERAAETALFVLFLPRDQKKCKYDLGKLKQICDTIQASGGKLLAVGEQASRALWLEAYPCLESCPWLDRPINMAELGQRVEEAMRGGAEPACRKRVLIVDDDPVYAGMVRAWMMPDYRVDILTDGMQVMRFLQKNPVDLILLDYMMPIMDGPDVLRLLRKEPRTKDIPVIFLTGAQTAENVKHIIGLKPDAYILKSTTREVLLGYIADVFHKIGERMALQSELNTARTMAYKDPLTGVKSKQAWTQTLETMNRTIKEGRTPVFGVGVFDLNDLKKINDVRGQGAGDRYIREGCQLICDCFQHSPVFRIGGDEFAVILERTDFENRERLMAAFDRQMEENRRQGTVVVSGGIAAFEPGRDSSVQAVFERADARMYERKKQLKAMEP